MQVEKKYILPVAGSIGLLSIIAFAYVGLPQDFVFGQNATAKPEIKTFAALPPGNDNTQTKPTAQPAVSSDTIDDNRLVQTGGKDEKTNLSPLTLKAAAENARLQYNLPWAFGGKSQRGWFLYAPLIQQTIVADKNAGTPEFANAVADWQQEIGMMPNGILDDETLYKIIEYWQSRRLKNSDYPSPEQLLTAPIADFYDPTRDIGLLKVERETYAAYKKLVAAAAKDKTLNLKLTATGELAADEKFLKIVSAFRSREYQEKLRKAEPNSGRAGLATNSPHFTGRALDLFVGGEPVTTKDFNRAAQIQTPVYKWLVKNAGRFGFVPYFYEPWHWEYIPERLRNSNSSAK